MALSLRLAAEARADLEQPYRAGAQSSDFAHVFIQMWCQHGPQAAFGVDPEHLFFHDRTIEYAHFFEACAGQDDRSMHLKETRRAQNGGKAFLQFQNKRPAWAFAQGVEAFVLLRDEPGLKALEGTVTLCAVRKPGLQVFERRAEFAKPPLLFFAEDHCPPPSARRIAPDFLRNTVP